MGIVPAPLGTDRAYGDDNLGTSAAVSNSATKASSLEGEALTFVGTLICLFFPLDISSVLVLWIHWVPITLSIHNCLRKY